MKNTFRFLGAIRSIAIIALIAMISFGMTSCKDPEDDDKTPVAGDYDVGTNLSQLAGSVSAVSVTPKSGKSPGAVTVYYASSASIPQTQGSYAITFDVAAAKGWKAASGLTAGTLSVGLLTFLDSAFEVTGNANQIAGEVTAVGVTWSRIEEITISYRGIDGTVYTKSEVVPQAVGKYEVIIDIAALPGVYAAISNRRMFTFEVELRTEDISFNISWNQITDAAVNYIDSDISIYRIPSPGKSNTAEIILPGDLDDYEEINWGFGGSLAIHDSLTITLDAADYDLGTRALTIYVKIDGNEYNKTVNFNVFMY